MLQVLYGAVAVGNRCMGSPIRALENRLSGVVQTTGQTVQRARQPVQIARQPVQSVRQPVQTVRQPVQTARQPVQIARQTVQFSRKRCNYLINEGIVAKQRDVPLPIEGMYREPIEGMYRERM